MWDQEEQQSFDELKKRLASAEILGYFDKSAQTKVIADASSGWIRSCPGPTARKRAAIY